MTFPYISTYISVASKTIPDNQIESERHRNPGAWMIVWSTKITVTVLVATEFCVFMCSLQC